MKLDDDPGNAPFTAAPERKATRQIAVYRSPRNLSAQPYSRSGDDKIYNISVVMAK
jgi:hypothetical protein